MKEWSNPYNSFNSMKGLLYKEQFDGILQGKLLPPVEVNLDPCNNCQLDCVWCNAKNIIDHTKKVVFTREHLLSTIRNIAEWGVKGLCFAGGGEPTLCPDLADAMYYAKEKGLEVALISNGLFINERQITATRDTCRWIGISVDAATKETYLKLKGKDCFDKVIENIGKLKGANEITFKFLIHPDNQHELAKACKLAKESGATVFHSRILSEDYVDNEKKFDYVELYRLAFDCRSLEDENFKVFTITHKQDGKGNRRINFDKCKASPLLCMLEANGDVSVCIDRKGDPKTRLCSHENFDEFKKTWGSKAHFDLLDKICPKTDCKKCTMTIYQELLDAYKSDKFCRNFP
jgi:MoaA/NifB/PqqE/SkfB family radical SAM enzyme